MKKNPINENKSCAMCGFFIPNETTKNAGYCLYYLDEYLPGENLKIPLNEERETAQRCPNYIRKIKNLSKGDFLLQQTLLLLSEIEDKNQRKFYILSILGTLIALGTFVTSIMQILIFINT